MQWSSFVSSVEQKLFGTKFQGEDVNKRLGRIETNVFGLKSNGTTTVRINKLKTVFGQIEISPKSANKVQPKPVSKTNTSQKMQNEDSSVKYAIVDDMEKKVLNHIYPNDNIYRRLSRLETVVFSRSMNTPLSDRVDKLKIAVFGNVKTTTSSSFNSEDDISQLSNESVNLLIDKMENDIFSTTYSNELLESRLSRLEIKLFNSASPEDPVNDRIERLSAVISARPTNELYKDMASLRQYQDMSAKVSAAALLLLLLKGMLF
ncbi:MAG: hypothetical protein PHC34_05985 [Candidatus Gastranaerophilales bacterium]|nr:hypothetical protein [Candidatus Gastranaerophilales bacterium]